MHRNLLITACAQFNININLAWKELPHTLTLNIHIVANSITNKSVTTQKIKKYKKIKRTQ